MLQHRYSRGCTFRWATGLLVLSAASILLARALNDRPLVVVRAADNHPPAGYHLPFGEGAYLPSHARTEFAGFLRPDEVPTAAYCGRCHAAIYAQWRESGHSNSFRAPWYVKNVNELGKTRGVEFTRHCEGCHNPVALFTGALNAGSVVPRPHDEDGITCMVCHSIRALQNTAGTGSYVMGKPTVMLDAEGQPMAGLPTDAEIYAHPDRHSAAVMRPLLRQPELCGTCHKAEMPKMLNGYKWLRTFTTYDEWQQSSWSRETPLSFYEKTETSTCQSCHMKAVAVPANAADGKTTVPSHRWLGANTAVPTQYGFSEQLRQVEEYLRDHKMQVDIFGLAIEREETTTKARAVNTRETRFAQVRYIAPLGGSSEKEEWTVQPGDWVRVDVLLQNRGVGHSLVPELRDFYETWMDFSATTPEGKEIFRSGAMNAQHRLDLDARAYTANILSNAGAELQHHEIWNLYTKAYDASIMPGRSDMICYRFRVPEGVTSIRLSAALRYRRFNRAFTDWVFGDKPEDKDRFPTVVLTESQYDFAVGTNAPHPQTALPADLTDMLRWNNAGIGLLDRQQPHTASQAFRQVVALDPKYERGYVNVAIAEYQDGNFAESQRWLDRAMAMKPSDPRALYYRGLNLRWTNHYDEAITVQEGVAKLYPRFRQVHQELGYLLMQQKRYMESRAEFEQVLAIDPDDPFSHRWLGPVLDALGDHAGAEREARLAAQTSNDPVAGFTAQNFWREHPNLAARAMPHHVYSDKNKADEDDVRRVLNLQNLPSLIWQTFQ